LLLSDQIWDEKRRIVAQMYGYPYESPDVGYCARTEAFRFLERK
jgi:hypothetical protein